MDENRGIRKKGIKMITEENRRFRAEVIVNFVSRQDTKINYILIYELIICTIYELI